jgi:uncharacterized protein YegP (UPF0339 family)
VPDSEGATRRASERTRTEQGEFRWKLIADNGEIISDSADGYRHKGYAIAMAEKLNPNAELVIEE